MYSTYSSDIEFNLSIVKKLTSVFERQKKIPGVDAIYVYGHDIQENTIEAIRKLDIAPIEILDPTTGLDSAELLLKNDKLRKNAYKFSASTGAALRCLQ